MLGSLNKICPPTRCCVTHDCCYYRLEKLGCGTKFLEYKFSHKGGQITCAGKEDPEMLACFPHEADEHTYACWKPCWCRQGIYPCFKNLTVEQEARINGEKGGEDSSRKSAKAFVQLDA